MSTLTRRVKSCAETSYFLQFAKNEHSQGGEDGILKEIFRLIGTNSTPLCVDVGAWDGVHLSNTRALLCPSEGSANTGLWSGVLFEACIDRAKQLETLYHDNPRVHTSSLLVEVDGQHSLSSLLSGFAVPDFFDFLSIDVDGADYHIWKSIRGRYTPRVVCVEFNPTIPNDIVFIQEPDCSIHKGSSLLALIELGREMGYHLVVTTTFNAIFVHHSLVSALPPFENSIDVLHSSSMITEIFQTYEGELILCGPKKLIWHRVPINPQKIQVLSKKDRKFPFSPVVYNEMQNIAQAKEMVKRCYKSYLSKSMDLSQLESTALGAIDSLRPLLIHQHLEDDVLKVVAEFITIADLVSGGILSGEESCGKEEMNFCKRLCSAGAMLSFV